MNQQVIPLMLEWKDILAGKSGFLLNLQNAGGMGFWGVFFFFLSSPFTFLVVFIEKYEIYALVNVLVLLKLSLSAAGASLFFREEQPELSKTLHLFFCCSYAFCGYGLLYYQNLVWLDMLCLFPVLMLGFCRLIFEGKTVLFTASLTAAVVIQYYLSYMVLLALVIISFLFVRLCLPEEDRGKAASQIGLCTFLALLLSAVVWLPSLLQCLRSARTAQGFVGSVVSGPLFTELTTTLPVLLCSAGVAALPGLLPFFPSAPKRRALVCALLLTCVPVVLEPVNKLWHTGSYMAFPVRYGYIPVFLGLWCFAELFRPKGERFRPMGKPLGKPLLFLFLLLIGAAAALLVFCYDDLKSYVRTLWFDERSFLLLGGFSLLTAGLMWLAVVLCRKDRVSQSLMSAVLLGCCLLQGIFCTAALVGPAAHVPNRGKAILQTEGTLPDTGLYRVKQEMKFCDVNLLGAAGHLTLNHYTSLTDEAFLHAMKKAGYSSYWMETSACCGTALSDILLSNRYALTEDLKWKEQEGGGLGYLIKGGQLPAELPEGDRFSAQESFYRAVTGTGGSVFDRYFPTALQGLTVEETADGITLRKTEEQALLFYEIPVWERRTIYFDAFGENSSRLREKINGAFRVTVNGKALADEYPTQSCNGILSLGSFERETVYVTVEVLKDAEGLRSFGAAGLPESRVKDFAECLSNGSFSAAGSRISGAVTAEREDQALFFSIPYVPGMRFTVNGKTVAPRIVLDCFVEIPVGPGENDVTLTYIPRGVLSGAALSVTGLIASLALLFWRGARWSFAAKLWEQLAWPLLTATFVMVLLFLYVMPMAIYFAVQ